jgi:hypothetical protein
MAIGNRRRGALAIHCASLRKLEKKSIQNRRASQHEKPTHDRLLHLIGSHCSITRVCSKPGLSRQCAGNF